LCLQGEEEAAAPAAEPLTETAAAAPAPATEAAAAPADTSNADLMAGAMDPAFMSQVCDSQLPTFIDAAIKCFLFIGLSLPFCC
jgi:hypothetical protein